VDKRDPKGIEGETQSETGTIDERVGMLGKLVVRNTSKRTIDSTQTEANPEAESSL
jgi:hypothetical protein